MTTYKGVVKDHIVVLEDGAQLPDWAGVEVRLLEPSFRRDDLFAHVLANRITHDVGMDQMIEEDKQEREEHPETWLTHMARTSFISVGNSADSPEPSLRPLPATGHAAEILDV
jgi:hypothetical protein